MQAEPTLQLVQDLHARGIRRLVVLLRHAVRCYDTADPIREPFQPLTEQGKIDAYEFGLRLPAACVYRFFSSPVGRCIETAYQIQQLSKDIGVKKLNLIGNKIRSEKDKSFLLDQLPDLDFLGFIPFGDEIIEADLEGRPPFEKAQASLDAVKEMLGALE